MARRRSTKKKVTTHEGTSAAKSKAKPDLTTAQSTPQDDSAPETVSVLLRRRDFLERVAENSDFRPNQIKPIMDVVLDELGKALAAGEELNLPPFGKVTVNRTKQTEKADIAVVKLRRKRALEGEETPLAEAAD